MILFLAYLFCLIYFAALLCYAYFVSRTTSASNVDHRYYLRNLAATLFTIAGALTALELFFPVTPLLRGIVLVLWAGGILALAYQALHRVMAIRKVIKSPLIKLPFRTISTGAAFFSTIILAMTTLPLGVYRMVHPPSAAVSPITPVSPVLVIHFALWALCFSTLAVVARSQSGFQRLSPAEEEPSLDAELPDDMVLVRAYGVLVNQFLFGITPLSNVMQKNITDYLQFNPILFQNCHLEPGSGIDFEPAIVNLRNLDSDNRLTQVRLIFTGLIAGLYQVCAAIFTVAEAQRLMVQSYAAAKQSYGQSHVFINLLSSLPDGCLDKEKIVLLTKPELEIQLRERIKELEASYQEQKGLLVDLEISKNNLRQVITQNVDGIIIVDKAGKVVFVNPAAEALFGRNQSEWLNAPFDYPFEPGISMELSIAQASGEFLVAEIHPVPITWQGQPAYLASIRDITARKRFESELRQAQKMEAIGALAGGIAHDFNNILSSVIGYTELVLEDVPKDSQLEENLKEVLTASMRAKELVRQILAFARQAEGDHKPVQVALIAKEALRLLRATIPSSIEIEQRIDSQSPVMGDPTQIHQVLVNLCTNAAQAMEERGGTLTFEVRDVYLDSGDGERTLQGDYLKIRVADTGSGIAPEHLPSIFDPYFSTKEVGKGTGLGLAVVHGIVKSYGGEIEVHSELDQGSEFSVYLPLTHSATQLEESVSDALPIGQEIILFVDDEPAIANMARRYLERLGYFVKTRTNSVEALELFRASPNRFDLVITDMTMPIMNGDKLAKDILAIRPLMPIILCTGYSNTITEERAHQIGIKAFITKPVIMSELAKIVREVLDSA